MNKTRCTIFCYFIVWFCLGTLTCLPASAGMNVEYNYALASVSGPVKSFQARLAISRTTNEVFVFDPAKKDIRIFNEHGMETFRMGEEDEFAWARDFTVDDAVNMYVLFRDWRRDGIAKYNFRGDLVGKIELKDLPAEFADLNPSIIVYGHNKLYLADVDTLRIVLIDPNGKYQTGYAVMPQVKDTAATISKKKQQNPILDMFGFNVDDQGNMYFTVPMIASVFRLSPDGKLDRFGKAGSSAGQFGVIAGVAIDREGYVYVSDRLRCVVMVFDKDFNFINEFGFRGYGPSNLIVPSDVAVNKDDVFVSQAADRGVSCFRIIRQ